MLRQTAALLAMALVALAVSNRIMPVEMAGATATDQKMMATSISNRINPPKLIPTVRFIVTLP